MGKEWGWYPDDFCRELGRFAFVFADVEGVAGELIVVHRGLSGPMRGDWSRSGEQLLKALRECFDYENFQDLCNAMERLTQDRNLFMHGEWVFINEQSALVGKRAHHKSTQEPGYQISIDVTPAAIAARTEHLMEIEEALGKYLADKMGISSGP